MKNKKLTQIVAGCLVAGSLGLGGCSEYGNAFSRGLAETMVVTAAQESIKKEINPNAYPNQEQNQGNNDQLGYNVFFVCNGTNDLNKNGILEREEIFGYRKGVFNLDREIINVAACSYGKKSIILRSFTADGRLIGETPHLFSRIDEIHNWASGPNYPDNGDFIDNIKGNGPGDYVLTATYNTGETYRIDIRIERDKK